MKKTVVVFGATGAQGGSVARSLLATGRYRVRAVTRKPASPAAQTLQHLGAEIVNADLASPPSLNAALLGANAVFGVTSYWEHFAVEAAHGRNLVEAVAGSEVEHFVFSTLEPVAKGSAGALRCPHFDIKAEHEELTRKRGIPATFVHIAFYYENFLAFFPLRPAGDGSYEFSFPQGDTPLAAISVEDYGKVVAPLFDLAPNGAVVKAVGDEMPATGYAAAMSDVLGVPVRYRYVTREAYAALDFPSAGEVADMFEYYRLYMPRRKDDLALCRALAPELQTFEAWAKRNAEKLRATLTQAA